MGVLCVWRQQPRLLRALKGTAAASVRVKAARGTCLDPGYFAIVRVLLHNQVNKHCLRAFSFEIAFKPGQDDGSARTHSE